MPENDEEQIFTPDPPAPAPAAVDEGPTWPQGPDYDPREDPGPPREEDQ